MTNEEAVRQLIASIGTPNPTLETLALTLAQRIDAGVEDKSLAPLARELRATVEALTARDRPVDPFAEFFADLSPQVRDPAGTVPADDR